MDKKEFTGVWIPRHIMENTKLKPVDRLIYAEIACFNLCYMSNETLGEKAGCSERTASRIIKKLISFGYVRQVSFDGRARTLKVLYDLTEEPRQNGEAATTKTTPLPRQIVYLDNNIDNNKKNTISEVEFLKVINPIIGRDFRTLPRGWKKTIELFTLEEVSKSLTNLSKDAWHSERLKTLKLDYLIRSTTIDKFLTDDSIQIKEKTMGRRLNMDTLEYEEYEIK